MILINVIPVMIRQYGFVFIFKYVVLDNKEINLKTSISHAVRRVLLYVAQGAHVPPVRASLLSEPELTWSHQVLRESSLSQSLLRATSAPSSWSDSTISVVGYSTDTTLSISLR